MSMNAAVLVRQPAEVADVSRDQSYLWTTVLVLGVIAAFGIALSLYVDPPVLDAWLVGP
jgi:predicted benzoate:H+ symporter BenE